MTFLLLEGAVLKPWKEGVVYFSPELRDQTAAVLRQTTLSVQAESLYNKGMKCSLVSAGRGKDSGTLLATGDARLTSATNPSIKECLILLF